jgi:hypothetical protein
LFSGLKFENRKSPEVAGKEEKQNWPKKTLTPVNGIRD